VPWYAKLTAACVAAYALSPIDLVPDFIPVLGYLDDLVVVPLGMMLAVRMIPDAIMAEHRASAAAAEGRPTSKTAAAIIVASWVASIVVIAWLGWRYFSNRHTT
jgi:uncharacterized membrane protein YkvA (DUF1232 family)